MRKSKLLALTLCIAILASLLVGIAVSAEGEAAVAKISQANIEYGDKMYMSFTVQALEGAELPATVGVAAYRDADCTELLHSTFVKKIDKGGVEYYASLGIPAKEINTTYYYAVVTEADDVVTVISEAVPYSVSAYLTDRADDEGVTDAQKHLYETIVKYGAAADGVLDK